MMVATIDMYAVQRDLAYDGWQALPDRHGSGKPPSMYLERTRGNVIEKLVIEHITPVPYGAPRYSVEYRKNGEYFRAFTIDESLTIRDTRIEKQWEEILREASSK